MLLCVSQISIIYIFILQCPFIPLMNGFDIFSKGEAYSFSLVAVVVMVAVFMLLFIHVTVGFKALFGQAPI
jgi:hypothetical protein